MFLFCIGKDVCNSEFINSNVILHNSIIFKQFVNSINFKYAYTFYFTYCMSTVIINKICIPHELILFMFIISNILSRKGCHLGTYDLLRLPLHYQITVS